jgi:hypothetical protein
VACVDCRHSPGVIALAINLFPESGWGNRLQQFLQILPIFIIAGIFSVRKKVSGQTPMTQR